MNSSGESLMRNRLYVAGLIVFAAGVAVGLLADPTRRSRRPASLSPFAALAVEPLPGLMGDSPGVVLRPIACQAGDATHPVAPRRPNTLAVVIPLRVNGVPVTLAYEVPAE